MSQGFNPLSLFKPTGNPIVQKLLQTVSSPLQDLLQQQSFPTQFRKDKHESLQKYMTYKKYLQLVQYITQLAQDEQNKKRGYKYPFIAVEILTIANKHTEKYFVQKQKIIEQQIIIEEYQIQQEIDVDRSFMSSRSQGSIISDQSQAEKQTENYLEKENDQQEDKNKNNDNQNQQKNIEVNDMPEISNMQKRQSQINQDDFPFMQQIKKTKKVKRKRQKIIVHQYQPLIKRLLSYFDQPLNHTLTGYVCRVLNALLTSNPQIYSQILLKAQTSLLSDHLQSRSTEQLLIRLLIFENDDDNDIKLQYNLILMCLHKIFENTQNIVIQNITFLITQILIKFSSDLTPSSHHKKLMKQLIRLSFFHKVTEYFNQIVKQLDIQMKNNKNNQYNQYNQSIELQIIQMKILSYVKIFMNFLQLYLKIKQKDDFKDICQNVLNDYEDNFNQFVETAYKSLKYQVRQNNLMNCKKKFGMTRILIINVIFSLIKQNLGFCQQILAEKNNFLQILLKIVQKSPLNSILHNSVFAIYDLLLDNSTKKNGTIIIGSLFRQIFDIQSKYSLLQFSFNTFQQNKNLSCNHRKGYTGHLLKICQAIYSIQQFKDQQSLQRFKKCALWLQIIKQQLHPFIQQNKRTLGNYFKKKHIKASIQFQKQVILQNHKQFLKGTKFTTLDMFQNFIDDGQQSQQSDSEDNQYKKKRRASINNKQVQKEIQEEERQEFMVNCSLEGQDNKQFNSNENNNNEKTNDSITQE